MFVQINAEIKLERICILFYYITEFLQNSSNLSSPKLYILTEVIKWMQILLLLASRIIFIERRLNALTLEIKVTFRQKI